jgi:hypothetical protein
MTGTSIIPYRGIQQYRAEKATAIVVDLERDPGLRSTLRERLALPDAAELWGHGFQNTPDGNGAILIWPLTGAQLRAARASGTPHLAAGGYALDWFDQTVSARVHAVADPLALAGHQVWLGGWAAAPETGQAFFEQLADVQTVVRILVGELTADGGHYEYDIFLVGAMGDQSTWDSTWKHIGTRQSLEEQIDAIRQQYGPMGYDLEWRVVDTHDQEVLRGSYVYEADDWFDPPTIQVPEEGWRIL